MSFYNLLQSPGDANINANLGKYLQVNVKGQKTVAWTAGTGNTASQTIDMGGVNITCSNIDVTSYPVEQGIGNTTTGITANFSNNIVFTNVSNVTANSLIFITEQSGASFIVPSVTNVGTGTFTVALVSIAAVTGSSVTLNLGILII